MADLSDVEQALVGLIAGGLYPAGTALPSVLGAPCRVYRGWPAPKALEGDLRAGRVNINVHAGKEASNVTRYPAEWQSLPPTPPTLGVTLAGDQATVTGTVTAGLNTAIIIDGAAFTYTAQAADTLAGIAAALATLIAAARPASSSGATLTLPGAVRIEARIGGFATQIREVARMRRDFTIGLWCPSPGLRDAVGGALSPLLAATPRLYLPDGTAAHLLPVSDGAVEDGEQRERLYRRILTCSAEYPLTQIQTATEIVTTTLTTPNP